MLLFYVCFRKTYLLLLYRTYSCCIYWHQWSLLCHKTYLLLLYILASVISTVSQNLPPLAVYTGTSDLYCVTKLTSSCCVEPTLAVYTGISDLYCVTKLTSSCCIEPPLAVYTGTSDLYCVTKLTSSCCIEPTLAVYTSTVLRVCEDKCELHCGGIVHCTERDYSSCCWSTGDTEGVESRLEPTELDGGFLRDWN